LAHCGGRAADDAETLVRGSGWLAWKYRAREYVDAGRYPAGMIENIEG